MRTRRFMRNRIAGQLAVVAATGLVASFAGAATSASSAQAASHAAHAAAGPGTAQAQPLASASTSGLSGHGAGRTWHVVTSEATNLSEPEFSRRPLPRGPFATGGGNDVPAP